ncbi:MAG: pyruvate formate lyase-activating protein [Clostridia bacterium]|nr:pyruvate formate lyase-activating protein [Clostridia bacterium]
MKGYVHSLQSMGTVDGPGVRAVLFTEGCPLRCAYCHNPDTWEMKEESLISAEEIAGKIIRLYPYIKNGGVTFSGGEPCMQSEFLYEVALKLKEKKLHIALDTSGCILDDSTKKLLSVTDMVLLDVKMTSEEDYKKHTGGSFTETMSFLSYLDEKGIEVRIRHVVVPGINDSEEDIIKLKEILSPYSCITKTELLPFRTLCLEKYENMGIDFPLRDTPQLGSERLKELQSLL